MFTDLAGPGAQPATRREDGSGATYLVVPACQVCCALPVTSIGEITHVPSLLRPAGMPTALEGLVRVGKQVVPTVRLEHLFGYPDFQVGLYSTLVFLNTMPVQIAVLTESVERIVAIGVDEICDLSETMSLNACAVGEALVDEKRIVILDPDRILLQAEQQALLEYQSRIAERISRMTTDPGEPK